MHQTPPLTRKSIRELRRLIQAGELLPSTVASESIDLRKQYDPLLHAFHTVDDTRLLHDAALADLAVLPDTPANSPGSLAGVPMSVKSVIGVEGYDCYGGTRKPLPAKWCSEGAVVRHLRSAGALVAGVTHAAELGVGGLGVNEHWGTPRNPWDANSHRVPGGSSAGAAVSIWEGACAFALGTDTGGSVRVPASAAGLVGMKVTTDRWPMGGVVPLASRFDTIGVLTHTVDDAFQIVSCIDQLTDLKSHSDGNIQKLTLSDFNVVRASSLCWQGLDPGIGDTIAEVLSELCEAGMRCDKDDSGLFAAAAETRDGGPNTAAIECNALLDRDYPELKSYLSEHVREFLASIVDVPESEYRQRLDQVTQWRAQVKSKLGPRDIIVLPTIRCTVPTMAQLEDREVYQHYSDELLHNTVLPSICGFCAITLPVGLDACGMPVGLQLVAAADEEMTLLTFARLVESVLGTGLERTGVPPMFSV